jgi:hypothetical protein
MDLHGTFPVLLKLSKGTEKISDMKRPQSWSPYVETSGKFHRPSSVLLNVHLV